LSTPPLGPAANFRIVGDPSRLRILSLLDQGELTVRELVTILELRQPTVSKHLSILRGGGWLRVRKEGTWSWYGLAAPSQHPAGEDFVRTVLEQAGRSERRRGDDRALKRVLAARQRRAGDAIAQLAGTWDQLRPAFEHPEIQAGAVGALVPPGLRVLDIGTGSGALLPLLAATGAQVTALDRSPVMLSRARELCTREGIADHVHWQRADVQALPLRDGCYDGVYCVMVLHHVARPETALAEMSRVLRPGGALVLVGFTRHDLDWLRGELGHVWLGFAREEIERWQRAAGLIPHRYLRRESRAVALARAALPPGLDAADLDWPDVFLAVGQKPAPETEVPVGSRQGGPRTEQETS